MDRACRAGFLGNFASMHAAGASTLALRFPASPIKTYFFDNAEAAFQAAKFVHLGDAVMKSFELASGEEAFGLKESLKQYADFSYGGYGSNAVAMEAALAAKFRQEPFRTGLLATRTAFLLEHNDRKGRDDTWSDDHDGSGSNLLGCLLMRLRSQLTGVVDAWLERAGRFDSRGKICDPEWAAVVREAAAVARRA